ncbi:unnamed protein product, partial [Musa acuminata var. zebrina]
GRDLRRSPGTAVHLFLLLLFLSNRRPGGRSRRGVFGLGSRQEEPDALPRGCQRREVGQGCGPEDRVGRAAQRSKSSDKAATKAEQSKLSAYLYRPVKTEDCFWSIGWTIHFYTFDQAKSDGMVEILQKMMFEQWQKAMGLPTSDDM